MTDHPEIEIATGTRFGDAPILVFCDHASNAMPDAFEHLGLPSDIMNTHIAWDIGAGAVAEGLARQLGGAYFACGFSRLIVDVNRDLHSTDLIPAISDQIPVPGNQMLTEADRAARIDNYHEPYHNQLAGAVADLESRGEPLAISVHSFTDRLMGAAEERPWGVGMLWNKDRDSAKFMIDWLRGACDWPIGDNEPYDARMFNYSVDRHISSRGMRHLTFEVRQDLIGEREGTEYFADLLARGVGAMLENA